jgi:hypothetical protein
LIQATTLPAGTGIEPRARMRVLDGCLRLLEDARAAGHRTVPVDVSRRIAPYVDGVSTGMSMARAMDVVFSYQQRDLVTRRTAAANQLDQALSNQGLPGRTAALSRRDAEVLTARIRSGSRDLSLLVLEAHERRAWRALSYRTWDAYVRAELGLSRSRSYELIDHARVLLTLKSAANLVEFPNISPHVANQIRPVLGTVVADIRRKAEGGTGPRVIQEAIRSALTANKRNAAGAEPQPADSFEPSRLTRTVEYLAALPPPSVVAALLTREQMHGLKRVAGAAAWLSALARELSLAQACPHGEDSSGHRPLTVVS